MLYGGDREVPADTQGCTGMARTVSKKIQKKWSPEQIAG